MHAVDVKPHLIYTDHAIVVALFTTGERKRAKEEIFISMEP